MRLRGPNSVRKQTKLHLIGRQIARKRNARVLQAFPTIKVLCRRTDMPAKSKAQQKAAGAALAAKRGETPVSTLKGASKSMYASMSEKQLDEFASTKRKGKPEHVPKKK